MIKKTLATCPACGSNQVSRHEKNNFDQLTLGDKFSFKEIYYICANCQEEGDFLLETDKNYLAAQKNAQVQLIKKLLEDMSTVDITMAMFERVFELPTRTLTRWKNGDFSASALALLRITATYPWLIEVAEHRFEPKYASVIVIKAAADELEKINNRTVHIPSQTASGNAPLFFSNSKTSVEA